MNLCRHTRRSFTAGSAAHRAFCAENENGGKSTTKAKNMIEFYNIEQVCALTGFSRGGVYKQVKSGLLPAPIKWGKASRWPGAELNAVFEARIAEKSESEIRELIRVLLGARAKKEGGVK